MALTRAQLLAGNESQGIVLPGQVQAVSQGPGVFIDTNGQISVDPATTTGLVKLNNGDAYNAYVWPNAQGTAGQVLKAFDSNGNLTWGTVQGSPVVTVSLAAPLPADVGELWYDGTTGYLKVFQNLVSPNGWTNVAQAGLPVDPDNVSAVPDFVSGNGTIALPYVCSVSTVTPGAAVYIVNTVSISGLAPFQYVPIVDLRASLNGGRFHFTNNYADATGLLTFQTVFIDLPSSGTGNAYIAAIRVGYGSAYINATVNILSSLTLSQGTITGAPTVGTTVAYTPGIASGGSGGYSYAYQWFANGLQITGANSSAYVPLPGDVGKVLSVAQTVTDSSLSTVSVTTTASSPTLFPTIPTGTWNPGSAMNSSVPGTSSATWGGVSGTVTSEGCAVLSLNGTSWFQSVSAVNNQPLFVQWDMSGSGCGNAATGTTIQGKVTGGGGQNNYQVQINRKPDPALVNISDSNVPLGATVTKQLPAAVLGINATAYITLDASTTGTSVRVSTDGGSNFVVVPSAPSTTVSVTSGTIIQIRQTVGFAVDTDYIASINVGDGTGSAGGSSTYQNVRYTARTVASAAFPNSPFTPSNGPNASPASVSQSSPFMPTNITGTATATWGDGSTTLTGSNLQLAVGAGTFANSQFVADSNTVKVAWLPSYIAGLAHGATATGSFTNNVYTNTYSFEVDKAPLWSPPSDPGLAALVTQQTTGNITPTGFNCPVVVSFAAPTSPTLAMTSVQVSVNNGTATPITLGSTTITLNPGDFLEVLGNTGNATSTAYGVSITMGASPAQTWRVTTTNVPNAIQAPVMAPTGGPLNPATNVPGGITLSGGTYTPSSGSPGAHTSSDWQLYRVISGTPGPPTTEPPNPSVYSEVVNVSNDTNNLTTYRVPTASLTVSSTYYSRARYSASSTSTTSPWANWGSFTTVSSFAIAPGTVLGGGYFAGQMRIPANTGTIYNIIVAPKRGDTTGPNPTGSLLGEYSADGGATRGTIAWKNVNTAETTANEPLVNMTEYGKPWTDEAGTTGNYPPGTYPVFQWCKGSSTGPNGGGGIGGFTDWYIPAEAEAFVTYFFFKPTTFANATVDGAIPWSLPPYTPNTNFGPNFPDQTTVALFQDNNAEAYGGLGNNYWVTNQGLAPNTNSAFSMFYVQGVSGFGDKTTPRWARAIRRMEA